MIWLTVSNESRSGCIKVLSSQSKHDIQLAMPWITHTTALAETCVRTRRQMNKHTAVDTHTLSTLSPHRRTARCAGCIQVRRAAHKLARCVLSCVPAGPGWGGCSGWRCCCWWRWCRGSGCWPGGCRHESRGAGKRLESLCGASRPQSATTGALLPLVTPAPVTVPHTCFNTERHTDEQAEKKRQIRKTERKKTTGKKPQIKTQRQKNIITIKNKKTTRWRK